jgi:SpoVK/Ycf46/Vps4 family AAA+-type ATPase
LTAGYVGQSEEKTREVLESALGGVLFIDEAYSITQGQHNSFGQKIVNEILKFMEDHRKDIVIIFAGYTKEMDEFMNTNSGLSSRVPHRFDFEDYTADELVQIGLLGLRACEYEIDENNYAQIVKSCYAVTNDRSNGRWVRNLNEKLIMFMSKRISKDANADINLITNEDISAVGEFYNALVDSEPTNAGEIVLDKNGYALPN